MDALLDILSKIYQIWYWFKIICIMETWLFDEDPQMDRQDVEDYLGISESTYKRKVKGGKLKPMKLPGGDKFYKSELLV